METTHDVITDRGGRNPIPLAKNGGELRPRRFYVYFDFGGAEGACGGPALGIQSLRCASHWWVAELVVEQVFYNDSDDFIEAIYTFPLEGGAAVDAMSIRMGHREIEVELKDKAQARAVYEAAKEEGRTAGLTEQQRDNVFTQSVANIPPREEVTVELHVVQPIERVNGHYELVIPLVVAPRFSPLGQVEDVDAITPAVSEKSTGVDVDIEVELITGIEIRNESISLHQKQRTSESLWLICTMRNPIRTLFCVGRWRATSRAMAMPWRAYDDSF